MGKFTVIEGVDVCSDCGQEVCDCGSGMMHSMEPDEIQGSDNDEFGEAELLDIIGRN
jgi:hypothetical protein